MGRLLQFHCFLLISHENKYIGSVGLHQPTIFCRPYLLKNGLPEVLLDPLTQFYTLYVPHGAFPVLIFFLSKIYLNCSKTKDTNFWNIQTHCAEVIASQWSEPRLNCTKSHQRIKFALLYLSIIWYSKFFDSKPWNGSQNCWNSY